ncbi:hypothetical protein KIH39_04210 [Telmatocola sphagniphila]|jgi:hypothetical protein|uniref:SH3 domain-containing protein n=1 Tax=Telmatocola sphagniphila TaxID=1123043 RepID=A0A8E6EVW1_9BACT|nr:hypothetical protein [Telmatocola sphagniphila]QVL33127.1 hypothetical protein KIH39_04210 [Telmatocola sphagniphila]
MRSAWLSIISSLVFVCTGRAADPLQYGTVSYDIEVRAAAGWNTPTCGTLAKGQQVVIHHVQDEFYAILPPEGSVSWVNHKFLGKLDPNLTRQAVEIKKEIEFYAGSTKNPSNIVEGKLPKGEIVEIVGEKVAYDGSTWYPILPKPGEFRYLPKASVSQIKNAPVDGSRWDGNASLASRTRDGGVPATLTSRTTFGNNVAAPATGGGVNHPLWSQAEQAYQSGDHSRADKLFTQIYQEMNKTNNWTYDEKLMCFNRIAKCQEMIRKNTNGGDSSRFDNSGRSISNSSSVNSDIQSSGSVYIRRAAFEIDGKQAYALENERRQVMYYATVQSGVAIENYVGRQVEAKGTVQNRGDVRGVPYMNISQISSSR